MLICGYNLLLNINLMFNNLKRKSVFVIVKNTGYFSIMYWMIGNKFKFIISIINTTYSS